MQPRQGDTSALIDRLSRALSGLTSALGGLGAAVTKPRRAPPSSPESFRALIDRRGRGCWRWRGPVTENGVPYVRIRGRRIVAHRHMWVTVLERELPEGARVYRTCANRRCLRPEHLALRYRRSV